MLCIIVLYEMHPISCQYIYFVIIFNQPHNFFNLFLVLTLLCVYIDEIPLNVVFFLSGKGARVWSEESVGTEQDDKKTESVQIWILGLTVEHKSIVKLISMIRCIHFLKPREVSCDSTWWWQDLHLISQSLSSWGALWFIATNECYFYVQNCIIMLN